MLKIKRVSLYDRLSSSNVSLENFLKETQFDKLSSQNPQGYSYEWSKSMVDFLLMSESEFQETTRNPDGTEKIPNPIRMLNLHGGLYIKRRRIIPSMCHELDRFSVKAKASE